MELDGVGLLGLLAPASGSLTGDTIPKSRLDYSIAIRSYSSSVSSMTLAAVFGGLIKDWTNCCSTAPS